MARPLAAFCDRFRIAEGSDRPLDDTITKTASPEARELEKKKAELARLEARLAERELDLPTLQAELRSFEGAYLRVVGSRLASWMKLKLKLRTPSLATSRKTRRHKSERRKPAPRLKNRPEPWKLNKRAASGNRSRHRRI